MAEELNNFFCLVFFPVKMVKKPYRLQCKIRRKHRGEITDIIITPELVKKHLLKLKRNKSPGPDNLGSAFLLDTCDFIATKHQP